MRFQYVTTTLSFPYSITQNIVFHSHSLYPFDNNKSTVYIIENYPNVILKIECHNIPELHNRLYVIITIYVQAVSVTETVVTATLQYLCTIIHVPHILRRNFPECHTPGHGLPAGVIPITVSIYITEASGRRFVSHRHRPSSYTLNVVK